MFCLAILHPLYVRPAGFSKLAEASRECTVHSDQQARGAQSVFYYTLVCTSLLSSPMLRGAAFNGPIYVFAKYVAQPGRLFGCTKFS